MITPYLRLARDYRKSGQYDLAIAEYDNIISIDRYFGHGSVYTLRGDLYCLQGRYVLAISDYTTAINIAPKLIGLGPLEDQRDPKRVENVLKDAYCGRGRAYHAEEEYDLAIADLTEAGPFLYISNSTSGYLFSMAGDLYHHSLHDRGLVYYSKGEYGLAIADFEAVIRMYPASQSSEARRNLDRAIRAIK